MIYDLIIVGAGAAGLFAGASLPNNVNGLIIEKSNAPGKKLLMSGGGQCNLTNSSNIKDFILHYGENGSKIRSILYQFSNKAVIEFFQKQGIQLLEREDGKIFPKSLQASDIVDTLVKICINNGLSFIYSSPVSSISFNADSSVYTINCNNDHYQTQKLLIATGGCSYPTTGSDGKFFSVLSNIGIDIKPTRPALVPIYVQSYPYKNLAGISFAKVIVSIYSNKKIAENADALLITHDCFSGPAILNISRYASAGNDIAINYYPNKKGEQIIKELLEDIRGNSKNLITVLYDYFNTDPLEAPAKMPKRFLEAVCLRANIDPSKKASQISASELKLIVKLLIDDRHSISGIGGYNIAMATSGGVSLNDLNPKSLESKDFPNLYFAGEVLDVDGDTGGYNLQFAFSSGFLVAQNL